MLTDEILKDLMEGLSGVSLGNKAVSTDVLGDAYEYLIGKFADITKRKKAGEFYTRPIPTRNRRRSRSRSRDGCESTCTTLVSRNSGSGSKP
jgi:hypothetical protein